jgi:hypothetical protein
MGNGQTAIMTVASGRPKYLTMAKALALTLDMHFVNVPRVLVGDTDDREIHQLYDLVVPTSEKYPYWFAEFCALDETPFDRILFIDADCLVVRNLEPVIERLKGHDFAAQGVWSEGADWYGDFAGAIRKRGLKRAPILNSGLLYYERTDKARLFIDRVLALASDYDSLDLRRNRGRPVDETCISFAMAETGIGTIFSDKEQFSFTPWRQMSRLHFDVLRGEYSFIKWLDGPKVVKPYIYHSAHADWDLRYWRAVKQVMRVGRAQLGRTEGHEDRTMWLRKAKKVLTRLRYPRPDKW